MYRVELYAAVRRSVYVEGWSERAEPADAGKTSFTVGNLMRQGYREWERGYRRQRCIEQQVEDDPEHIEDRSNADWCYGSITDRDVVVDGTTYELEGVYTTRPNATTSSTSISPKRSTSRRSRAGSSSSTASHSP